jgi:hypothetical protein
VLSPSESAFRRLQSAAPRGLCETRPLTETVGESVINASDPYTCSTAATELGGTPKRVRALIAVRSRSARRRIQAGRRRTINGKLMWRVPLVRECCSNPFFRRHIGWHLFRITIRANGGGERRDSPRNYGEELASQAAFQTARAGAGPYFTSMFSGSTASFAVSEIGRLVRCHGSLVNPSKRARRIDPAVAATCGQLTANGQELKTRQGKSIRPELSARPQNPVSSSFPG